MNRHLLQGPDLTNNLVGVLIRFRQERTAIMCDIESMFHQVHVNAEHRNLLRFLWWPDGDVNREPVEYRMTVHLFGATSSPGCANIGLKTTADKYKEEFGNAAASYVRHDFYVDDGLKSVPSPSEAIDLITKTKGLCDSVCINSYPTARKCCNRSHQKRERVELKTSIWTTKNSQLREPWVCNGASNPTLYNSRTK